MNPDDDWIRKRIVTCGLQIAAKYRFILFEQIIYNRGQ